MKKYVFVILLAYIGFASCEKNTVSKIPHISLVSFTPSDSMTVNIDTAFIVFNFTDGNADIGNDTNSSIWIKDSRDNSGGFRRYDFPEIDGTIEDPKKGLTGTCYFLPDPQPVLRLDSLHIANGDTMHYEFYITDRERNESNHIITHQIIIKL